MMLGSCIKVTDVTTQYPIFADFVELPALAIMKMEKKEYAALKKAVDDKKIKVYSSNGLTDMRLTGPDVDFPKLKEYIEALFYKLAELNTRVIVFGSGKAKNVLEGFSRERAWEQLFEFGRLLSDEAEKYGQMVAVEPLAYRETNIINTVEEAEYYIQNVNRKNFKYLVDFFHFDYNKEDFSVLEKYKDDLIHVHFASQVIRKLPVTDEDWAFVEKWMTVLKRIGYDGAISFEGGSKPAEDMNNMLLRLAEIEKKAADLLC